MNDVAEESKGSPLPLLLGVLVVVGIIAGVFFFLRQGQAASEEAARLALKEMGAIVMAGATSKRVETLTLEGPNTQNKVAEAMPHIAKLGKLKVLNLSRTNVEDEHLEVVGKLPSLTSLSMNETGITDAGIEHLGNLKLQALHLDRTKVTNKSMPTIGKFTDITNLDLSYTSITDLSPLSGLENLNWAKMNGIPIDDAAVDLLVSLPSLKQLSIIGTQLDDSLKQRLLEKRITIDEVMKGEAHPVYGDENKPEEQPAGNVD